MFHVKKNLTFPFDGKGIFMDITLAVTTQSNYPHLIVLPTLKIYKFVRCFATINFYQVRRLLKIGFQDIIDTETVYVISAQVFRLVFL